MGNACLLAFGTAVLAFMLGCGVFSSPITLHGAFLYDDKGTVTMNPIVTGEVGVSEVWTRDLWGENNLTSLASHKSWRPLATLSLRWNYQLAGLEPLSFHVVNMILHGLSSALAVPACLYMEAELPVAAVASLLFATHPVHVEAVAAVTGRCDVMCGFFFLSGFVAYASSRGYVDEEPSFTRCVLMFLSLLAFGPATLLSKELGIMLPYWCLAWDAYVTRLSLGDLMFLRPAAQMHLLRYALCATFAVILTLWRLHQNGGTLPELSPRSCPVALLPSLRERLLSNAWQHVRHAALLTGIAPLCPDWSDGSVGLVSSFMEWRAILSYTIYSSVLPVLWRLLLAEHAYAPMDLGVAFAVLTFVLSSNVFIWVGFVLAERVLYLPSLGTSLATAFALQALGRRYPSGMGRRWMGMALVLVAVYAQRCWTYAETYGGPERLWPAARRANPHSGVIIYELGMSLHNVRQHQESVDIMTLGFEQYPHLFDEDMQAYFILAESQLKVGDCAAARDTCLRGVHMNEQIAQRTGGMVKRGEAYLHVTLSRCSTTAEDQAQQAYAALAIAETNGDHHAYNYALEYFVQLQKKFAEAGFMMQL